MSQNGALFEKGVIPVFLLCALIMALGYVCSWFLKAPKLLYVWIVAIVARLLLLPMEPGDDIWRYIWEGRVNLAGLNPYQHAPNSEALAFLRDESVWPKVGHPTLTAVYPPVMQLLLKAITVFGSSVLLFKSVFVLADLGIIYFLQKRHGVFHAMLYAWNPLILYSFAGGGHYDSVFILPIMIAISLADRGQCKAAWYGSALLLGASIGIKYASGPLAFWWVFQAWKRGKFRCVVSTSICLAAPLLLSWGVFYSGTAWHQLGPRDWITFSRSAQCLPWFVEKLTDFAPGNQFYMIPALLVGGFLALREKLSERVVTWFFFWVLLLSPAIHGWYFTWFIAAGIFVNSWSARLIGLSGFAYFMAVHNNATRGVWEINDATRLLLWLPMIIPTVLLFVRKRRLAS